MDKTETVPVVETEAGFSIEDINRAVDRLVKAQARASDEVGKVLVMAVYASIVGIEGSYTGVANTLLKVLRKSTKRDAIVAFLETYGKLGMTKAGVFDYFNVGEASALAWTKEYVAKVKLAAHTWESFKSAPVPQELDIETAVQNLITKAAKAQKGNKPVKHEKLIALLVGAMAKYHAEDAAAIDG